MSSLTVNFSEAPPYLDHRGFPIMDQLRSRSAYLHRKDPRLSEITFRYPQAVYINEEQVKEFCKKNNFILAPFDLLKTNIPIKNIEEIKNFRLFEDDSFIHSLGRTTFNEKDRDILTNMSIYTGDLFDQTINFKTENPFDGEPSFLFPVNESVSFLVRRRSISGHYQNELFYMVRIQAGDRELFLNIPYMVRNALSHERIVNRNHYFTDSVSSISTLSVDVGFGAFLQSFADIIGFASGDLSRRRITDFVSPMIIAPAAKLHSTNCLKVEDGYRVRFSEYASSLSSEMSRCPVYLQPFREGYLVVSQWEDKELDYLYFSHPEGIVDMNPDWNSTLKN